MKDFSLIGKSEQATTTGVNLIPFPYTDKDMIKNGVTFEVQPDGGVKIYGTATEAVDFFLSMLDYGNDSIFNNSTGNGKILSGGKDGVAIEYHGTNKRLYLTIAKGKTVNNVIYPQLQNGSTATPYEPYTGGKPSPSPEYPQEIKSVGKWNPEKQKYDVDVKVTGKNLFDIEKAKSESNWLKVEGDGYVHFPIRVKQDCKVTFSYKEKLTTGKKFYLGVSSTKTGDVTNWLYHGATASLINNKCTIVSSDGYVNLLCNKGAVQNFIDNIKTLQIEISDKKTEYQPYKEQTLTLTSERPITKWDKLVEQDGQIGWLYGGKIIESYNSEPIDTEYISSTGELSAGATVLYKLKEAEFVPLPQSEQDAIRALMTYYPTTVITTDGGEVNPDIEVSYIADTKNYIDQKIATIGKTVVETQKALL